MHLSEASFLNNVEVSFSLKEVRDSSEPAQIDLELERTGHYLRASISSLGSSNCRIAQDEHTIPVVVPMA